MAVQTFGDSLFWHPHVHVIATAGVFDADGTFHLAPTGGWQVLQELWRHALLRRLWAAGALADWHVARLQKWRHSGFTLDAGEAPIAADDAAGRRRLAEYLLRAPFSLEKITYNSATGSVLYRSERHWRTKRIFEVFSAAEFIAALLAQIPPQGVPNAAGRFPLRHSTSNCNSPAYCNLAFRPAANAALCAAKSADLRRRRRAAIKEFVGKGPWHRGSPPKPSGNLTTLPDKLLPYPRPRDEPLRYRAEVTESGEAFDQTGFELPPARLTPCEDPAQAELFPDDFSQPDATDGEPVFWTGGIGQANPDEDFVQADAPESY